MRRSAGPLPRFSQQDLEKAAHGFGQVSDPGAFGEIVDRVVAEQPAAVADFRRGQVKALGFLVGHVMQASRGQANPKVIRELLEQKLKADS